MASSEDDVDKARLRSARATQALGSFDMWRRRYRDPGLTAILVMQVLIMFVVGPMSGAGILGSGFVEALRFGMATTAILIVNRYHPVGVAVALVFVVSLLSTTYVRSGTASELVSLVNIGITLVFDLAVAWIVAHAAFGAGHITVHRIMGAIILYLYMGLIFAGIYRLEAGLLHPSFSGLSTVKKGSMSDFMYFSMGALTTSGTGTIVPIHPFARSLSTLESVIGQLYPATFIARLVTLHGTTLESVARRNKN